MLKFVFIILSVVSFNCLAETQGEWVFPVIPLADINEPTTYAPECKDWSEADTVREAVYLTITAVDWNQTLQINSNDGYEKNPILGSHPSDAKINTFIPAAMLAHYYIATLLPTEYRKAWQYSFIIIEASAVSNNLTTGIKVSF